MGRNLQEVAKELGIEICVDEFACVEISGDSTEVSLDGNFTVLELKDIVKVFEQWKRLQGVVTDGVKPS